MLAGQSRVHEIDGLRGIAILAVVIFHMLILHLGPILPHIDMADGLTLLAYGVDLFFVISGFLIGTILLRIESASGIGAFYIRRIVRIWPLYYLLLFLLYLTLPDKSQFADMPYWSFVFFIFNFWESTGSHVHRALGPLWSVAIEEQFYMMGPLLFLTLSKRQIRSFLLACLVLSPILRLVLLYETDLFLWKFTPARVDGICAGLLLALLLSSTENVSFVARHIKIFKYLMALLLISLIPFQFLSSGVLWVSFGHSLVVLAFACVLLVTQVESSLGRRISVLNWSVLRYLGLRCYSIYLFHIFFGFIAIAVSEIVFVQLVVEWFLILLFAHLSWRYIEAPLLNFGRRFSYRKSERLDRAAA